MGKSQYAPIRLRLQRLRNHVCGVQTRGSVPRCEPAKHIIRGGCARVSTGIVCATQRCPIRNTQMLCARKPEYVFALRGGKGMLKVPVFLSSRFIYERAHDNDLESYSNFIGTPHPRLAITKGFSGCQPDICLLSFGQV